MMYVTDQGLMHAHCLYSKVAVRALAALGDLDAVVCANPPCKPGCGDVMCHAGTGDMFCLHDEFLPGLAVWVRLASIVTMPLVGSPLGPILEKRNYVVVQRRQEA